VGVLIVYASQCAISSLRKDPDFSAAIPGRVRWKPSRTFWLHANRDRVIQEETSEVVDV